jgi:exodeoxyribonuclease VII small subunit
MNGDSPTESQPDLTTPLDELSYEMALSQLEMIVDMLESNDQTLAQSMLFFQRGQELAKYCASLLDQAELKIKQLSGENVADL